jgi:predicted RNase H-like nuclease
LLQQTLGALHEQRLDGRIWRASIARMKIVGVDGTKGGWVAVELHNERFASAAFAATFADVLKSYPDADAIAVDIPIGLLDRGARTADKAARQFLRGRLGSSVFSTPPRPVVYSSCWSEALELSKELQGVGISKQAYNLFARIRELDVYIGDPRIIEIHPEVSFALLGGRVLNASKSTWSGMTQRREILRASGGIELPNDLGDAGKAGTDDVLDAAVAAWSGIRFAERRSIRFPNDSEQFDSSGRLIAIQG